jgi:hypothetical protein
MLCSKCEKDTPDLHNLEVRLWVRMRDRSKVKTEKEIWSWRVCSECVKFFRDLLDGVPKGEK